METPKILLVDDENDVVDFLKDFLELKGYSDVETATSGQEALNIISSKKPRFAFLDIQLADEINGIEVLKRTRDLSSDTKVVMISGYRKEFFKTALALGAIGFIAKPVKKNELNEMISLLSQT